MKNLEILLLVIVRLVYWIFKNYSSWSPKHSAPPEKTRTEQASTKYNTFADPNNAQQISRPYPSATTQAALVPKMLSLNKYQAQKNIQPIPKKPLLKQKNTLEKKLKHYRNLHKAMLMHEILKPMT
jgi:hypothetical protein